jgi:DNA-binding SARP family transcriptional activator
MPDNRSIAWSEAYSIKVQAEAMVEKVTSLLVDDDLPQKTRAKLREVLSSARHCADRISPAAAVDREKLRKQLNSTDSTE